MLFREQKGFPVTSCLDNESELCCRLVWYLPVRRKNRYCI